MSVGRPLSWEADCVVAELYDPLGRRVWRLEQRERLRAGRNLIACRTTQAPGAYVLRLRAYGTAGQLLATKQQRLTKVR